MKKLERVLVIGYDDNGSETGRMNARVYCEGRWISPKTAKKMLRNQFPATRTFQRFNHYVEIQEQ